jgi:hypothetical protein
MQLVSMNAYQPSLKQIDFATAVHLPSNEFEASDLHLGLSVGPRQHDCRANAMPESGDSEHLCLRERIPSDRPEASDRSGRWIPVKIFDIGCFFQLSIRLLTDDRLELQPGSQEKSQRDD